MYPASRARRRRSSLAALDLRLRDILGVSAVVTGFIPGAEEASQAFQILARPTPWAGPTYVIEPPPPEYVILQPPPQEPDRVLPTGLQLGFPAVVGGLAAAMLLLILAFRERR